jgi:hypothetical protein
VALYLAGGKGTPQPPENLKPILLLHGFRLLGLAFVAPGVCGSRVTCRICSTSSGAVKQAILLRINQPSEIEPGESQLLIRSAISSLVQASYITVRQDGQ